MDTKSQGLIFYFNAAYHTAKRSKKGHQLFYLLIPNYRAMLKNSDNLDLDNSRIVLFCWFMSICMINMKSRWISNSKYYQLIWISIGNDSCNAIICVLLSIGKFSHLIVPLFYFEYNLRKPFATWMPSQQKRI